MALPSLRVKLRDFHSHIDDLLTWDTSLLPSRPWVHRLNELRFVRATLAWEDFLEQSFVCFLRGSRSILGHAYPLAVPIASSFSTAQALAIGVRPFGKWLNETWALGRATALFNGPHPYAPLASPIFPSIRKVRNRIVHRSANVSVEFRDLVIHVCGSSRPGLSPGMFLSEHEHGVVRLESYLALLRTTAILIAN
jgi:hypothetical protein